MSVRLQRLTPYRQSLKWTIQRNYYEARGAEAWRSGEVPSDVTSNYRAAYQHAEILLASLVAQYPRGVPKRETISVLELASGLGTYCANFFRAFEDVCRKRRVRYYEQLHYYFTDVVPRGLETAAANPYFAALVEEGRLSFHYLDVLRPEGTPFRHGQLHFVVANYLYCVLAGTVLQKDGERFAEKHIALHYDGPRTTRARLNALVAQPTLKGFARKLREEVQFVPVRLERRIRNRTALRALRETTAPLARATFTYPEDTIESLDALLPYLRRGGQFVIADKAYARTLDMRYEHLSIPNVHGGSFSHRLNVPLLERYARHKRHGAVRTADYAYGVQTLLITRGEPTAPRVADTFEKLFVAENYNEHASSWVAAGRDALVLRDFHVARRYFTRALTWRPGDFKLLGRLGVIAWQFDDQRTARRLLRAGKLHDTFNQFPFEEALARIARGSRSMRGLSVDGLGKR